MSALTRLLGLYLVAALLAEVLGRGMGAGALGAGSAQGSRVALTFDDGPSERTPELLAILEKYGARATFFVTREAARQHPKGLAALARAGHALEAHGVWHRHALLLWPLQEWRQVGWHPRQADPSGPPLLYRPPFGGHSPFTRLFARLQGRQVALWDVEGRDWTPAEPAELARHILSQLRPGSVLLLHDGPALTPALLEQVLWGVQERGWQAVTAHELPMRPVSWAAGWRRLGQSYGLGQGKCSPQ